MVAVVYDDLSKAFGIVLHDCLKQATEAQLGEIVKVVIHRVENIIRKQFSMTYRQTGGTYLYALGEDLSWAVVTTNRPGRNSKFGDNISWGSTASKWDTIGTWTRLDKQGQCSAEEAGCGQ